MIRNLALTDIAESGDAKAPPPAAAPFNLTVQWRISADGLRKALSEGSPTGSLLFYCEPGEIGAMTVDVSSLTLEHTRPDVELLIAFYRILGGGQVAAVIRLSPGARRATPGLTSRELEVLVALQDGATNRVIADELGIALSTVNRHVEHIFSKLRVRNRTQAVATTAMAILTGPALEPRKSPVAGTRHRACDLEECRQCRQGVVAPPN